jgi:hypothetical protein
MLVQKLFAPFFALFLFSGCCSMLGICASASVHTSIAGDHQYAQQNGGSSEVQVAQRSPQSCSQ